MSGVSRWHYEETAGPSTLPLAIRLREASLRMTISGNQALVEEHGAVESIALDRPEACVADDLADLLFGGGIWAVSL